jgi:hypothetical protein
MRGHWTLIVAPCFLSAVASMSFAGETARPVAVEPDASRVSAAPSAQPEQILIEIMVAKAGVLVGAPHAGARIGKEGRLEWFPQPDPNGPGPQAVKFRSSRVGKHVRVALEASVDGDVIAKREMVISNEEGSELHFAGAGYSWHARINVLSPALVEARRLERIGEPRTNNVRSQ